MVKRPFRLFCALLALLSLSPSLFSQTFQRLYSHGAFRSPKTGIFEDITDLNPTGIDGEAVAAIGTTDSLTGLLTYHKDDGSPVTFIEFSHPSYHPEYAEAICRMPSGDIIACFYDPVDRASDIVRAQNDGTVVWSRRITFMNVKDVTAGYDLTVPGGEAIYFTGTNGADVAVSGMDGTGAALFQEAYYFGIAYDSTWGNEIHLTQGAGELTIVGTASSDSCDANSILLFQTGTNGAFFGGRTYGDPTCLNSYDGISLTPKPSAAREFIIAFENDNGTYQKPGVLDVLTGPFSTWTPAWVNRYRNIGPGFFRGEDFHVKSINSDGSNLLLCGNFESLDTPKNQASAYTMKVDFAGIGRRFNEYETALSLTANGTWLQNLIWNTAESMYYLVGEYNTTKSEGFWPRGSKPKSFWMIASDSDGNSSCSSYDSVRTTAISPTKVLLTATQDNFGTLIACPINWITVNKRSRNRCSSAKTGFEEGIEEAIPLEFEVFGGPNQELRVQLPAEQNAELLLLDLQGRTLLRLEAQPGLNHIPCNQMSEGIYLLRCNFRDGSSRTKKVFIR